MKMNRLSIVLSMALAAMTLSACVTTMSREQCLATDWQAVGFQDGARGYGPGRLAVHRKNCAEARVAPDLAAYNAGHREGIRNYCRPKQAYRAAIRGEAYRGVCPSRMEPGFLYAYEAGKRIHAFNAAIRRLSGRMNGAERDLRTAEAHIPELESRATSNKLKRRQRRRAVMELQHLSEEIGALRLRISRLAVKRANLRGKLSVIRPQYDREFGLRY